MEYRITGRERKSEVCLWSSIRQTQIESTGEESAYPELLEQSSGLSNLTNGCTPQPTGLQAQSISFTQTNIHSFNIHLAQGTVLNDEDTPANETHKKLYSQSIY